MIDTIDIRVIVAYILIWIANWTLIRPAQWLLAIEPTDATELARALHRNEMWDKYGLEGLLRITTFAEAYLDD